MYQGPLGLNIVMIFAFCALFKVVRDQKSSYPVKHEQVNFHPKFTDKSTLHPHLCLIPRTDLPFHRKHTLALLRPRRQRADVKLHTARLNVPRAQLVVPPPARGLGAEPELHAAVQHREHRGGVQLRLRGERDDEVVDGRGARRVVEREREERDGGCWC
jgi:hypothetical protein